MSDENKYNINDIVTFASQQNPLEVKNTVDALMIDKIRDAIAGKKIEVAKQMFGAPDEPNEDEVEDELEDGDEEEIEDDESEEDVEDSDDDFMDISDDELEELLNDLENLDLDADLEDDNLDSEENENGENA